MSISNTLSTPAGDVTLQLGSTTTENFDIIDITPIQYKWDINDITDDTIDSVPFIISSYKVTVDDESHTTGSKFEDVEMGPNDEEAILTVDGNVFNGEFKGGQYTVDDMADTVTFNVSIRQLAPGTTATFEAVHDEGAGSNTQVAPIQQVLESILERFGPSSFIIDTPHFDDDTFPQSGTQDPVWGATTENFSVLKDCAAVEGAFYGIGFGEAFYVARDQTTNKVTITQDDIADNPSRDIAFPDLKDVTIDFDNDGSGFIEGAFDITDSDTVDSSKRQSFATDRSTDLVRVLYDDGDGRLESDTNINSQTEAFNVTNDGILAYEDVLRGLAPFTIKITVLGFDTIKPWQPFDITDTSGKLHEYTGKTYRPLEMSYSIMDTIDIIAYQIA